MSAKPSVRSNVMNGVKPSSPGPRAARRSRSARKSPDTAGPPPAASRTRPASCRPLSSASSSARPGDPAASDGETGDALRTGVPGRYSARQASMSALAAGRRAAAGGSGCGWSAAAGRARRRSSSRTARGGGSSSIFQQGVGGVAVHVLGAVDHHDAPATLRRGQAQELGRPRGHRRPRSRCAGGTSACRRIRARWSAGPRGFRRRPGETPDGLPGRAPAPPPGGCPPAASGRSGMPGSPCRCRP